MKLVFHQFRKDVLQFRVFLAIWFGLLLLDLAVNLGWVGRVVYNANLGFEGASNVWTAVLPGVIWALAGLLPSLVVLADSPARRDGFLATRPLPKGDLMAGKILFVLVMIVAPWVLQEWIHLTVCGAPGWVIERGTLERLLFTAPVAFSCAAFAALWPDPARWARALGILLAAYALLGVLMSLLIFFFHFTGLSTGPDKSHGLVNCYALALGLAGLAIWHSRGPRSAGVRWGVLFLTVIASQWVATSLPWDFFKLQPADPARAQSAVAGSGWEIPLQSIFLEKVRNPDESDVLGGAKFTLNATVKTKEMPARLVVWWSGVNPKLMRAGGGQIRGSGNIFHPALFENWNGNWTDFFRDKDYAAWAPDFPEDVLFHTPNVQNIQDQIALGNYQEPTNKAERSESLTLQASLEARVYQWKKIADLPMKPGASSTDEFGFWKFVTADLGRAGNASFFLERTQINLTTAADPLCSSTDGRPVSRMAVMVYDPVRHVVTMPSHCFDSTTRGKQTALSKYFLQIQFDQGLLANVNTNECRIVVFEETWVGSVPELWKSAPFTLNEKGAWGEPSQPANVERLDNTEFTRRVSALKEPAPDAPRRDVALYLAEALQLVNAHGFVLNTNDILTQKLARFVPAHLALFLDGIPAMSWILSEAVLNAIEVGATDAQKPLIIAALPETPELAEVVLARGWVEEARPQIEQLAKSPKWLPVSALRAVVALRDPQLYPRLLEQFDDSPSEEQDEILRTVPALAPKLDEIITRHWRSEGRVLYDPGIWMASQSFELAFRDGNRHALERFYQILDDPNCSQSNNQLQQFAFSLRRAVQAPGLNARSRGDDILAWMRKHRPEDFVFNPALRKFVLKHKS